MQQMWRLLLLFTASLCIGEALYLARQGFSPRRLMPLIEKEETLLSQDAEKILEQPFYYLGRGRQCFAFASQDGLYVLKCPRTDIYRTPLLSHIFRSPKTNKKGAMSKAFRKKFVLESFRIAHEILAEETGTIAIHLGEGNPTHKMLSLRDPLGFPLHIPLDQTIFILQHKYPLWTPLFLKAKEEGNREKLLEALIDGIIRRAQKGVLNRDRSFLRNYAFDGETVHQIDIGDFFQLTNWDPQEVFRKSVEDSLDPIREWLTNKHPEMLPFFESQRSKISL